MSRPVRIAHIATSGVSIEILLLNQLRQLSSAGYQVEAIASPGSWQPRIEAAGVPFTPISSLKRREHGVTDVRALAEIGRVLSDRRFDIVHTHIAKAGLLGRLASRFAGVKNVVHTVHGLYFTGDSPFRTKALAWGIERAGAYVSDAVLFQNPDDMDLALRTRMVGPAAARYLGNGIDLDRFRREEARRRDEIRAELGAKSSDVVVGMVARLVWPKGFRAFFDAAAVLKNPTVHFVVVGSPDQGSEALDEGTIRRVEREGAVRFLGPRDDMVDVYGALDIVALPSFFSEGIPRALMEPAAMGLPLVTTQHKGCKETVVEGVNGMLIPPRDSGELIAALRTLIGDEDMRRRYGAQSRLLAERTFDEREVVRRTIDVYNDVMRAN